jgi:ApbE superfamily uncharacterized protein (UPF0280 family)
MKTKITITTEQETIEKAKVYARKQKSSLSNLVENYLKFLAKDEIIEEKEETPDLIKQLRGSLKMPKDFDYKKAKEEYLTAKYL